MSTSSILVLAEISDKVPGQWSIPLVGIAFGLPIYFAARHGWAVTACIPMGIFALFAYGMFNELHLDKYIRESIVTEFGHSYHYLMITTCVIPVILGGLGIIRKRKTAANKRLLRTGDPRTVRQSAEP